MMNFDPGPNYAKWCCILRTAIEALLISAEDISEGRLTAARRIPRKGGRATLDVVQFINEGEDGKAEVLPSRSAMQ